MGRRRAVVMLLCSGNLCRSRIRRLCWLSYVLKTNCMRSVWARELLGWFRAKIVKLTTPLGSMVEILIHLEERGVGCVFFRIGTP